MSNLKKSHILLILVVYLISSATSLLLPLPWAGGAGVESDRESRKAKEGSRSRKFRSNRLQKKNRSLVYGIKVRKGRGENNIRISWRSRASRSSSFIIKRSNRPIATAKLFRSATTIHSKKISARKRTFMDTRLPRGLYYYAILTKSQARKPRSRELISGQNYTVSPFAVSQKKGSYQGDPRGSEIFLIEEDERNGKGVRGIQAFSRGKSVVVLWSFPFDSKNDQFKIYRGKQPLNSKEGLEKANLIGQTTSGSGDLHRFVDTKPIRNRHVYYGVVANNQNHMKDFPGLIRGQSYVRHKYVRKKQKESDDEPLPIFVKKQKTKGVRGIEAFNRGKSVVVLWSLHSNSKNAQFKIYRGSTPLDSKEGLERARLIGQVTAGTGDIRRFIDRRPIANRYVYYGVVVNDQNRMKDFQGLVRGQSYVRHKHRGKKQKKPPVPIFSKKQNTKGVKGIEAFNRGKSVVVLWSLYSNSKNAQFKIYRGRSPLDSKEGLEKAKLIGQVTAKTGDIRRFVDTRPIRNRHVYYGVVVNDQNHMEGFSGLVRGQSYIRHKYGAKKKQKKRSNVPVSIFTKKQKIKGVRGIEAFNRGKSVVVLWSLYSSSKNAQFKIYRGRSPLDSKEGLEKAKLIGQVTAKTGDIRRFVDTRPIRNRHVYYGVIVNDQNHMEGFSGLVRGQSYIRHKYGAKKKKKPSNVPVPIFKKKQKTQGAKGIETFNRGKSVVILWSLHSNSKNTQFKIYRGSSPLGSKEGLEKAKLIGQVTANAGDIRRFIDTRPIRNRYVYYGVVVNDQNHGEDFPGLVRGQSYIRHKYAAKKKKKPSDVPVPIFSKKQKIKGVKGIETFNRGKSVVILWSLHSNSKNAQFKIYRGRSPLDSKEGLERAKLIGQATAGTGDIRRFVDTRPIRNRYVYYGVVANGENHDENFSGLIRGQSYIRHKYAVKKKKKPSNVPVPLFTKKQKNKGVKGIEAFNRGKSVVILWSLHSNSKNAQFKIYRGRSPLDSKEGLERAKLIGQATAGTGDIRRFVDTRPIRNRYVYYGVVANGENHDEDFSGLVRGQSYIRHKYAAKKKKKLPPIIKKKPQVSSINDIRAFDRGKSVVVLWTGGGKKDSQFKIYRSQEPLDSKEAIEEATLIGRIRTGSGRLRQIVDRGPIHNRNVYYGVVIDDQLYQENFFGLVHGQSYIRHKHDFKKTKKTKGARGIQTFNRGKTVVVVWSFPSNSKNAQFKIYRGKLPLGSREGLEKAKLIGQATSGTGDIRRFIDTKPVFNRHVYYGIVVNDQNHTRGFPGLIRGQSYARHKYIRKKKKPPIKPVPNKKEIKGVKGIQAFNRGKTVVVLWSFQSDSKKAHFKIFRGEEPLDSKEGIEKAKLIGQATAGTGDIRRFVDSNPVPNRHVYYGVVVEEQNHDKDFAGLIRGQSYSRHKYVRKKKKKKPAFIFTDNNTLYKVKGIRAFDRGKTVAILWSWKQSYSKGLQFKIYRSKQPLDSKEAIEEATLIGRRTQGNSSLAQFIDTKPLPNQNVYYGIVVGNQNYQKNFTGLRNSYSYIRHKHLRKKKPSFSSSRAIRGIRSLDRGKSVVVLWSFKSSSRNSKFKIYRSSTPPESRELMERAKLIGTIQAGPERLQQFIDINPIPNQTVYYGVLIDDQLYQNDFSGLVQGRSYTQHKHVRKLPKQNRVKGIRAFDRGETVVVVWSLKKVVKNAPLKVYRSREPLDTREAVENAKLLGRIRSGTGNLQQFIDTNPLPNQDVYYGVLLAEQGYQNNFPGLIRSRSYTRHRHVRKLPKQSKIKGIRAFDRGETVVVVWSLKKVVKNAPLKVYRSREPLDTREAVENAKLLGRIRSGTGNLQQFIDTNPLPNQNVYYGVLLAEQGYQNNFSGLIRAQSYARHRHVRKKKPAPAPKEIKGIRSFDRGKDVVILWSLHGAAKSVTMKVYRSFQSLETKQAVEEAKLLGRVRSGTENLQQFIDTKPIPNKNVYYGVSIGNELYKASFLGLRQGRSYLRHRHKRKKKIESPSEKHEVQGVQAEDQRKHVIISWFPKHESQRLRFKIYRSSVPLDSRAAVSNAKLLGNVDGGSKRIHRFTDKKPIRNQEMYYGIVAESALFSPDFRGLRELRSYIKHRHRYQVKPKKPAPPKKRPKPVVKANYRATLNRILHETYTKKRYTSCSDELTKFLFVYKPPMNIKSKAYLYQGICSYQRRLYKKSLKYFSKPLVRKYYPSRSRFWFERTIEKIR